MKRIFFLLFGFSVVISVAGQYSDILIPQNEVSFNLFSIKKRQVVDGGPQYYPYFFQGISYRRKIRGNLIRFNFSYFQKLDEVNTALMESQGNFTEIQFGVGYQRNFLEKMVQPYVAGDLIILGGRHEKENETIAGDFFEKIESRHFGIGIAPAVGVRLQATRALSFSLESSVQLLMLWESGTRFHWEPTVVPEYININDSGFEARLNPVSAVFITLEF